MFKICLEKDLWQHLERAAQRNQRPWCVLGDFNCVRLVSEKPGGNKLSEARVKELNDCLIKIGLCELKRWWF